MKYKLFDLIFKSEVKLSSVIEKASKSFDIKVVLSKNYLPNNYVSKSYELNDRQGFFFRKKVGLFEVTNGNKIKVTKFHNAQSEEIENALLNFPIAICMSQRGEFVLHASCVRLNNKTLLFSGPSHSGKSTLASYLHSRGAEIISEDISVINLKGSPKIYTYCPFIKLSKEAASFAKLSKSKRRYLLKKDRCGYPVELYKNKQSKLDTCFFIGPSTINKIDKMSNESALKNIFKYSYISTSDKDLQKVFTFISKVAFYRLEYVKEFEELKTIYSLIKKL